MSFPGAVIRGTNFFVQDKILSGLVIKAILISICMLLFACHNGSDNKNSAPPESTSNTISASPGPRVTIGVDGITNQSAIITNPDNSESDVTLDANWISADESIAIVLEPGIIQGIAPGATTVDVTYNGTNIDSIEIVVLAVIPADISWTTMSDWAVYKDGPNGPWTPLQRDITSGNYLFTVTDPNALFAVAEFYPSPFGMNKVDIAYLKVDDLLNNTLVTNNRNIASNVTITIEGAEATDQGFLTSYDIFNGQYYWSPSYDLDITPTGIYSQTSDLLANIFETGPTGSRVSLHYYRENDVAFADDFTATIDIRGPLSFPADTDQTVTVVGLNGEEDNVYLDANFTTANGSRLNIARNHIESYGQEIPGPISMRYRGVPQLQQRAGDTHRIIASAGYLEGVKVSRIISTAVSGDYSVSLPQPMLPTDFNWEFLNTGTNLVSRFTWNAHLDAEFGAADYYSILLRHITTDVSWNIKIDPLWLDPSAMTIDTPNLSIISGWDPAFNISEGFATYAELRAFHSNVTDTELLRDGLVDGVIVNRLSLNQTMFP